MLRSITLALMFCTTGLSGQNLIRNGCFDQMIFCPSTLAELGLANNWKNSGPTGGELFHTCATGTWVGIPNHIFGNEQPMCGNGYVGISLFQIGTPNFREYFEQEFKDTLVAGHRHEVSFWVSRSDTQHVATDRIEVVLGSTSIVTTAGSNLNSFSPQIKADSSVHSSKGWVQIIDTIFATGLEKFITFGNFSDDANTSYDTVGGVPIAGFNHAYYFFDSVSVIDIDTVYPPPPTPPVEPDSVHLSLPNVFTPNDDNKNRIFLPTHSGIDQFNMKIYNRWGEVVFETDLLERGWDGRTFAGKVCPDGTYYYVSTFVDQDGNSGIRKGNVQLLR